MPTPDRQDLLLQQLLPRISPHEGLKGKVLGKLGFANETLTLTDLPATSKYANHLSWLAVVQPLIPQTLDALFIQEIWRDKDRYQLLVVAQVDLPEEIHEGEAESFFILKGQCACTIGGQVLQLGPGDYLDVPLHVTHDVRLLTSQVTAIVQCRFTT